MADRDRPTGVSPSWTVITAVCNPVPDHLEACVASVSAAADRSGAAVEHVLVDDGSTDQAVSAVLATHAAASDRVVVHLRDHNGGIVAASNDALARASHDWVVLLDHDDVLAPNAFTALTAAVLDDPGLDVIYSDHDLLRVDGRCASPVYKPDLSPEWLRQHNYITHLVAIRRSVLAELGGFRPGTDGAQDHDLLLRLLEHGASWSHVPEVLVHWRQSPASVATDTANKPAAFAAGRQVIADHLQRCGVDADVVAGPPGVVQIRRHRADHPLVSVVIPTRGSTGQVWGRERVFVIDAVRSIIERSTHRQLEFVVVADTDTPCVVERGLTWLAAAHDLPVRFEPYDEAFNFSTKINRGVAVSSGDVVLVLNDDTELIEPASIERMLGLLNSGDEWPAASRSAFDVPVGAVGAKLVYPDGTLQHAGHLYHGEFMHAFIGWDGDHPGPNRLLAVDRECAGVTAAAMLLRRAFLDDIGGFPEDLPLHFNDVDLCRSITEQGHRILVTPHASWYHFEGRTRRRGATMEEWLRAASRWPTKRPTDRYANPNLTTRRADWLELPGRSGAPPYELGADGSVVWA